MIVSIDTPFRCPGCKSHLRVVETAAGAACASCGWHAADRDAIFDFVRDTEKQNESDFYDAEYSDTPEVAPASIAALEQLWVDNPYAPYNELVLQRMQDIRGKIVVVLGGGAAPRELHFLTYKPSTLVISDLARPAMRALRDMYLPDGSSNVSFAAIDAEELPFSDQSVDVVYGYLFVHHLPHLDAFLREVARVLRPSGRAVFLDAAYAPIWEWSKRTWLWWLMRLSHRVNPVSPEDLRFTLAGGFRIEDLEQRIRAVGALPSFQRSGSLHYLAVRGSEILARLHPKLSLGGRTWVAQPNANPPYKLVWTHRRSVGRASRARRRSSRHIPRLCDAIAFGLSGASKCRPSSRRHPATKPALARQCPS